jgi:hypothetical protein
VALPEFPEFRPKEIIRTLVEHEVDFVVVGGLATMALGSAYPSYDLDVAYARDTENLERLAGALRALKASLRGAPTDVPFVLDAKAIQAGAHFTFLTAFGSLDILDRPDGSPPYRELKQHSIPTEIDGEQVRVASLDHMIGMKEATGRPHDKTVAAELRAISDELRAT